MAKNLFNLKNEKIAGFVDFMAVLIFILLVMILLSFGYMFLRDVFAPKTNVPADLSFMLRPYNGLPFAFWLFTSMGLMFGLAFHGFNLVMINSNSINEQNYYENIQKHKTRNKMSDSVERGRYKKSNKR